MPVLIEKCQLLEERPKAICVFLDDGTPPRYDVNKFWIPISLIETNELEHIGDIGDIEVRSWFFNETDGLADAVERSYGFRGEAVPF